MDDNRFERLHGTPNHHLYWLFSFIKMVLNELSCFGTTLMETNDS